LGKWEALTKTIGDLGLANPSSSGTENFGRNRYKIQVQVREKQIGPSRTANVTFSLTEDEALRRTSGTDTIMSVDVTEITNQIQNLPKWSNFTTALKHLKEIQLSASESGSSTEA
jgi:hypothetical protein